jgi:hypothetical protein
MMTMRVPFHVQLPGKNVKMKNGQARTPLDLYFNPTGDEAHDPFANDVYRAAVQ